MKMTLAASLALTISCIGNASAAQNPLAQACAGEIRQYCATIPAVGHAGCLRAVTANVSAACRAAVAAAGQDTVPRPNAIIGHDNATNAGTAQQGGGGREGGTQNTQGDGY